MSVVNVNETLVEPNAKWVSFPPFPFTPATRVLGDSRGRPSPAEPRIWAR
jgi:hypothetical protein